VNPNNNENEPNLEETLKLNKEEVSNIEDKLNSKIENKEVDNLQTPSNLHPIEDYKECSICLEPIIVGKRLHCGHINHLKCLK